MQEVEIICPRCGRCQRPELPPYFVGQARLTCGTVVELDIQEWLVRSVKVRVA